MGLMQMGEATMEQMMTMMTMMTKMEKYRGWLAKLQPQCLNHSHPFDPMPSETRANTKVKRKTHIKL
jgi:hypothetical protein